jgi:hypothetical protein
MRYLKYFRVYETGVSSSVILSDKTKPRPTQLQDIISEHLLQFKPNIDEPKDSIYWKYSEGERKLIPNVSLNMSKYGMCYDISFVSDFPVNLKNINKDLLFIHNDIFDILSDFVYPQRPILSKFEFFGHKISGQKDGRTLEVQDITDEANDLVDKLKNTDLESNNKSIFVQFILKDKSFY